MLRKYGQMTPIQEEEDESLMDASDPQSMRRKLVVGSEENSSNDINNKGPKSVKELQEAYPEIVNEKHKEEDNIRCDICLQFESEDHDQIIICEGCLGAVHQSCYQKDIFKKIPEGDWLCMRCEELRHREKATSESIRCGLCTDLKGVLCQVSSGHFMLEWVHPICILWNPHIYFKDFQSKAIVQGDPYEYRRCAKKDQSCTFCDDRLHKGFKLECDFAECKETFHITCAAQQGIIYECDKMIERGHLVMKDVQLQHEQCHYFCKEHLDLGIQVLKKGDRDLRTTKLKRRKAKNPFKLIQARVEAAKLYGRWQQKRPQTEYGGGEEEEQVVDDEAGMFVRPKTPILEIGAKKRGKKPRDRKEEYKKKLQRKAEIAKQEASINELTQEIDPIRSEEPEQQPPPPAVDFTQMLNLFQQLMPQLDPQPQQQQQFAINPDFTQMFSNMFLPQINQCSNQFIQPFQTTDQYFPQQQVIPQYTPEIPEQQQIPQNAMVVPLQQQNIISPNAQQQSNFGQNTDQMHETFLTYILNLGFIKYKELLDNLPKPETQILENHIQQEQVKINQHVELILPKDISLASLQVQEEVKISQRKSSQKNEQAQTSLRNTMNKIEEVKTSNQERQSSSTFVNPFQIPPSAPKTRGRKRKCEQITQVAVENKPQKRRKTEYHKIEDGKSQYQASAQIQLPKLDLAPIKDTMTPKMRPLKNDLQGKSKKLVEQESRQTLEMPFSIIRNASDSILRKPELRTRSQFNSPQRSVGLQPQKSPKERVIFSPPKALDNTRVVMSLAPIDEQDSDNESHNSQIELQAQEPSKILTKDSEECLITKITPKEENKVVQKKKNLLQISSADISPMSSSPAGSQTSLSKKASAPPVQSKVNIYYKPNESLYLILKFSDDTIQKDFEDINHKYRTGASSSDAAIFKRRFINPGDQYKKSEIIGAIAKLLEKLNLQNPKLGVFELHKSKVLYSLFQKEIEKKLKADGLWDEEKAKALREESSMKSTVDGSSTPKLQIPIQRMVLKESELWDVLLRQKCTQVEVVKDE